MNSALHSILKNIPTLLAILILSGCSSGGSDNDSKFRSEIFDKPINPISYSGLESSAEVNKKNLSDVVSNYFVVHTLTEVYFSQFIELAPFLADAPNSIFTEDCDDGGTISYRILTDANNFSFANVFSECSIGSSILNGRVNYIVPIASFRAYNFDDLTIIFEGHELTIGNNTVRIDGDIVSTSTLSTNLVLTYNNQEQLKTEELLFPLPISSNQGSGNYSGRIYMSDVGYLDVSLTNPFVFGTSADDWPVGGGPLQINGANGVVGQASSLTRDTVWLEMIDGNTVVGAAFTWDSLESGFVPEPADGGLAPVADVGDLSNYSFDNTNIADAETILLDGRSSADPENALMQYEWTILERPDNISTAYISDTSSAAPTFHPDRLGDYRIQLRVYDGTNWSAPEEFTVSLNANITPNIYVARSQEIPGLTADPNPLSDRLFTKYPIMLDASQNGIYNLEFINLSYQWRLISKPEGSIAELSNLQGATTSFVADPELGFEEYLIGLTVNDGLNSSAEHVLSIRPTEYEIYFQPSASINQSHFALLNEQVSLTANPDHMTYAPEVDQFTWRLLERPLTSQATLSSISAATTEFNADVVGKYVLELIVSNGYESSIPMQFPVYINDAQHFSYELIHDAPGGQLSSAPLGLYYGDLNNDARDDIFIPRTRDSEGTLLFQNTTGQFDPVSYFAFPRSLCPIGGIRNLNGDNVKELFVCTLDGLEIYRANSSNNLTNFASFAEPVLSLLEPSQFTVGDINNDGRPDLAWIAYINTPNGSAQAIKYSIQSNLIYDFQPSIQINLDQNYSRWHSIAITDINNDGLNDIVAIGHNFSSSVVGNLVTRDEVKLSYYPQQIDGTIGNEQTLTVAVTDTVPFDRSVFSDLNNDGRVDLITEARRGNFFKHTSVWIQNTNGTFDHQENLFGSNNYLIADLDMNGTKDIVLVRNQAVQIVYQINSLEFSVGEEYDIYPSTARSTSAAIGDIDGDGDQDIVGLYGGAYSSYQIYTLKNLSVQ